LCYLTLFGIQMSLISSWEDLQDINTNATTLDGDYELATNLDLNSTGYSPYASSSANSGEGWIPIGTETDPFTGTFDGQNHIISDVFIDRGGTNQGLFGYISGASIEKLGVIDFDISGAINIGTLVGRSVASSVIDECYASGGSVTATSWRVGGLVGYNYGSSNTKISNSYAEVTVEGGGSAGGLVGRNYWNAPSLEKCYSNGSVTGTGDYVGGLVGLNSSNNVDDCFWDTETSGQETSGTEISPAGTGKTTSEMKDLDTFTDTATEGLDIAWDMVLEENYIDEYWYIDDGNDYPRFGWQRETPVIGGKYPLPAFKIIS